MTRSLLLILLTYLFACDAYSQIPSYIPTTNLVAWYPFNGNANDGSGNGNNGTVTGASLTADRTGTPNSAYAFVGALGNQYISCINNNLPGGKTKRTISLWMSTAGVVISGHTQNAVSWGSGITSQANMVGFGGGGNTINYEGWQDDHNTTYSYALNTWYHVVVTFDSLNVKTYLNGTLIGSTTKPNWSTTGTEFKIGARIAPLAGFFNGKLDDIAIWSRVLTASEILALYNSCNLTVTGDPKNDTTLVGSSSKFIVKSSDAAATFTWQANTGSGYQNIFNGGQYMGTNDDTLVVSGLTLFNSKNTYRCIIAKGTCKDTSEAAILTVKSNILPPAYIPQSGLVAWYPFNGNTFDETGNGNNGVNYGASLTPDRFGNTGKAYLFSGVSSKYISCINRTLPMGKGKRTISLWMNSNGILVPGNTLTAFSYGQAANSSACMIGFGSAGNTVNFEGWQDDLNVTYAYTNGQWVHVTVTFDSLNAKVYINGEFKGSAVKSAWSTIGNEFLIGGRVNPVAGIFNGRIDDIAVWNRVLTTAEIQGLYVDCTLKISTHPKNDTCIKGGLSRFVVKATDSAALCTWQVNNGTGFQTLSSSALYSGVNNDTLIISGASLAFSKYTYRCIVTNSTCSDTSSAAILTVVNNVALPPQIPANGMVAWYPFNANYFDESGNGNNGLVNRRATLTSDRFGHPNSAFSFAGADSQVITCINRSLPMGKNKRTISLWMDPYSVISSFETLTAFSYGGAVTGKANMIGFGDGIKGISYQGWSDDVNTNATYSFNQWVNVTVTFDSMNAKIYLNGSLVLSAQKPGWNTSGADYYIGGCLNPLVGFFNGKIDDIGVWDRVLSASEIQNLYSYCSLTISGQPTGKLSSFGNTVRFVIKASDPNCNYQWQADNGRGFQNISNTGQYAGTDNDTLTVSSLTWINSNQKFRCIITSANCGDTSAIALLSMTNSFTVPPGIPLNGLVAWYPFNGGVVDESGNGNEAISSTASLGADRFGLPNKACSFNGAAKEKMLCLNKTLPMGKSKRTISLWLNASSILNPAYSMTALAYGSALSARANMIAIGDGAKGISYQGYADDINTNLPSTLNQWMNVVVTYDSLNVKVFVNGGLVSSAQKTNWNTTGSDFFIGGMFDSLVGYFNGKIDDIAVWNRVLSNTEIQQIYDLCNLTVIAHPGNDSGLVGSSAKFIVRSSDPAANYQWQANNGRGYVNLSDGINITGSTNDTLVINNLSLLWSKQTFRCIITMGQCKDTSLAATLTVKNTNPLPAYIQAQGLVAWYPFNGNSFDETGNGNNGMMATSSLTADRFGNPVKAYHFDGSRHEIITCINRNLPMLKSARTISLWLTTEGILVPGHTLTAFSYGSHATSNANMIGINGLGTKINYEGWQDDMSLDYKYTLNEWMHILVTYDGTNAIVYINGSQLGSVAKPDWNTIGTEYFIGGRIDTIAGWHNGKVDEVAVWGRVLTSQEVWDVYTGCRLPLSAQPVNDTADVNHSAVFFVKTNYPNTTIQWQRNSGTGFQNISNGGQFNGISADTLYVSGVSVMNNNNMFRCAVKSGDCVDTSMAAYLIVNGANGMMENNDETAAVLYPNPSDATINVSFQHPGNITVLTIYDQTGRKIKDVLAGGKKEIVISVDELNKGVYFITTDNILTKKLRFIKN